MGSSLSKVPSLVIATVAVASVSSFYQDESSSTLGVANAYRHHVVTSTPFVKTRRTTTKMTAFVTKLRGGEASATSTDDVTTTVTTGTASSEDEPSLDDKVYAAMKKLGLSPPNDDTSSTTTTDNDIAEGVDSECKDGICPMPGTTMDSGGTDEKMNPVEMAERISNDMNVDYRLSMAALGATSTIGDNNTRVFDETAARSMIQQELDLIASIPEDSTNVQTLVNEGYDMFLSRRALAFAEDNLEDARAILLADQMDEEAEKEEEQKQKQSEPDFVEVKANFDPTQLSTSTSTTSNQPAKDSSTLDGMPKPAPKESVVFEASTDQIQELVLESPVPVLLDVYADW
jgi:hypothetical protein